MTAEIINQTPIEIQKSNPSTFFQRVSQGLLGLLGQANKEPERIREYTLQRFITVQGELIPQGEPVTYRIK